MKKLLIALAVLSLTILFTLWLNADAGYVIIRRGAWSLETSLSVFLLISLSCFILLYFCLRLWRLFWTLPRYWREGRQSKRLLCQQQQLQQGVAALLQAQWKTAQQHLLRAPSLLSYLAAAYAAQQNQQWRKRNHYLQLAEQLEDKLDHEPEQPRLSRWLKIHLLIAQEDDINSLSSLQYLTPTQRQQPLVLSWLAQIYQRQQRWHELQTLLPDLRKYKIFQADNYTRLEQHVALKGVESSDDLVVYWQQLPKAMQLQSKLVIAYATLLQQTQQNELALSILQKSLDKNWHVDSLQHYAQLKDLSEQQQNSQYEQAKKWLKKHSKDAHLLACLGQFANREQQWTQAQQYFEDSLQAQPHVTVWQLLGTLHQNQQQYDIASNCFQQALNLNNTD